MKLKLFILFLIISAGAQAQIHTRLHLKDATVVGIPISSVDSVITTAVNKRIVRTGSLTALEVPTNTIDSVTHAFPVDNNLYSVISGDATLSQFKTGIDRGGLNPYPFALSGTLTAFTPTNTVFSNYGIVTANLSAATNNYVIAYHTLNRRLNTADFPLGENVKYFTANVPADSVFVTKTSTDLYVNGARVDATASNIPGSNGLVHKITDFLFPPGDNIYAEINRTNRGYDSIAKLVTRAAIADPTIVNTLQSTVLTLMAPTNEAFANFLSASGIGQVNNISSASALNILKDHLIINRKFLLNLILNNTNGSLSYGGGSLKVAQAPTGVISPTGLVVFYNTNAAVVLDNFDFLQENGVIHPIDGILTK